MSLVDNKASISYSTHQRPLPRPQSNLTEVTNHMKPNHLKLVPENDAKNIYSLILTCHNWTNNST